MAESKWLSYEPVHLEADEIEYELAIRNIVGLTTIRDKTKTLRSFLNKEMKNIEVSPEFCSYEPNSEIQTAHQAFKNIEGLLRQAHDTRDSNLIQILRSRIAFWVNRISRVSNQNIEGYDFVKNSFDGIYEAVLNILRENSGTVDEQAKEDTSKDVLFEKSDELGKSRFSLPMKNQDNKPSQKYDIARPVSVNSVADPNFFRQKSEALKSCRSPGNKDHSINLSYSNSVHSRSPSPKTNADDIRNTAPSLPPNKNFRKIGQSTDFCMDPKARSNFSETSNIYFQQYNNKREKPRSFQKSSAYFENKNYPYDNPGFEQIVSNKFHTTNKNRNLGTTKDFVPQRPPRLNREPECRLVETRCDDRQRSNLVDPRGNNHRFRRVADENAHVNVYDDLERQIENRPERFRQAYQDHLKIPQVHKWKIRFSGDGQGLSLNEFLHRAERYARGEHVSNEQLYDNIHYLLNSKAESWYWGSIHEIETWDELVMELKKEFLPRFYDYHLREEIERRVQSRDETINMYINDMKTLFHRAHPPLDEQYKLYIVQRNILPEFGAQLSTVNMRDFEDLVDLCRRIDDAKMMKCRRPNPHEYQNFPLVEPSCFPPVHVKDTNTRPQVRFNTSCVDDKHLSDIRSGYSDSRDFYQREIDKNCSRLENYESNYDDLARDVRDSRLNSHRDNDSSPLYRKNADGSYSIAHVNVMDSSESKKNSHDNVCFNCRKRGHNHKDCRQPRNGIFCYWCGTESFTVKDCPNCNKRYSGKSVNSIKKISPSFSPRSVNFRNSRFSENGRAEDRATGANVLPR